MSDVISRRRLLEAAGGITFLALVSDGRGAFSAPPSQAAQNAPAPAGETVRPLFTALPYLQPGAGAGPRVADGQEQITVAWQTNLEAATFVVTFAKGTALPAKDAKGLTPNRARRTVGDGDEAEGYYDYAAHLTGLDAGARYAYRVSMNGQTVIEGYFTTRKKPGQKMRFVSFGDNSYGEVSDRMIAYQTYQAKPDFVMNTGDNVYEGGRVNEYARYFFPVYNSNVAEARTGAPLLRSVPFYTVLGNHDVRGRDENKRSTANFATDADALGFYTCLHLPGNGPVPASPTPTMGPESLMDVFKKAAGDRFPRQANYSYDYGDAHFLCLDSNVYIDPTNRDLQAWIEQDLAQSKAAWKFVVFHHPAFNVGKEHYAEQHMRVLCPILEKGGVQVGLHGHEHNYQRTRPFTFAPTDASVAAKPFTKRLVPGTFTIDRTFDGIKNTKPKGIIYLTTGAGGKHLYDAEWNNNPAQWLHKEDDNADYAARVVSDRHSLTVLDMDAQSLVITQVDQWGQTVDQIKMTK